MIELVSVELTNFRSFSNATFAPLGIGQGMTAINGNNGMGKSSIVHGVLWALYGITPDGVRVGALRRQGSEGDVEVKVTFRHNDQTVQVTRGLRGRNDTTIAGISLDGVEQTNVSAKTATAWVNNRLGLDAEAFLTAFVVRQKELDSLVKARPADRRRTIERLAGIERMSAALDRARVDARQAQKLLDSLPEVEDPSVLQNTVAQAENAVAQTLASLERANVYSSQVQEAAEEAGEEVNQVRKLIAAVSTAQHSLDLAIQKEESIQETIKQLTVQAQGAENVEALRLAAESVRQKLESAQESLNQVKIIEAKMEQREQEARYAVLAFERTSEKIAQSTLSLSALREELQSIPQNAKAQHEEATAKARQLADQKGAARGEWDRLTKSIATLEEAAKHEAANCPTCNHVLPDPSGLISDLVQLQNDVQERGKQVAKELQEAEDQLTQAGQWLTLSESLTLKIESLTQTLQELQAAIIDQEAKAKDCRIQADSLQAEAQKAQQEARKAEAQLPNLRQAQTEAQTALRQAESAASAAAQLTETELTYQQVQAMAKQAQEALHVAQEKAKNLNLEQAEQAARVAAQKAATASQEAAQAKTAHLLSERDLADAQSALSRALTAAENRRKALIDVERSTALAAAMDEFRRDRLARLTPELSEVASDFVSRMTDGKYTAVVLDEDFTPVLTDASGAERPVAWLSGGEESAVALALRVAIGEVLAGQRGGMLVLDEVLTAQDPLRRQATMGAIRSLPRQVITINHVSEATDMVDLVAEVVSDGEGASTIMELAPDGPLGANVSDDLIDA